MFDLIEPKLFIVISKIWNFFEYTKNVLDKNKQKIKLTKVKNVNTKFVDKNIELIQIKNVIKLPQELTLLKELN